MGKKNKKPRHHHYDEDDLLLDGPAVAHHQVNQPDIGSAKSIDLLILEQQMTDLLMKYPDRQEDWLFRTIEKNMRLPKHSLKNNLETLHILTQMRSRVEEKIYAEEDEAESLIPNEGEAKNEHYNTISISAGDEAKLRAEARVAGFNDPSVHKMEMSNAKREGQDEQDIINTEEETSDQPLEEEEDVEALQSNTTFAVSSLIAIRPYTMDASSGRALISRIPLLMRQYLCIILYHVLSFILGHQARQRATLIWHKVHLPLIEAELLVKKKEDELRMLQLEAELLASKKEEDLHMLQQNSHLWSNEEECWIEKDDVFSPPIAGDDAKILPVTIRWNPARKQWERWSKNLTTRTKKQASGSSLTKGTFLPAREGDGWATSPNEAEIENKQLTTQSIHFFACLPSNTDTLDVVDITSWAAKSLLPKEAARALEAVDSGKVLFSFDMSAVNVKMKGVGVGKGKQYSKNKIEKAKQTGHEDDWIAMKGIGATAQVSERYLDKMQ